MWQVGELPEYHRASGYALEARGTAIAVPGELQESVGPCTNQALRAVRGSSVSVRRASCKASREPMCPGALSGGVRGARWTQIDAIAQADVPWRALEGRFGCQVNCRKARSRALTGLSGPCVAVPCHSASFLQNIARADMPWRPVERRLPCQMNCRKVWNRL